MVLVFEDGNNGLSVPNIHNGSGAIVPVISLTLEYVSKMIGDGTIGNEYRI